MTPHQWRIYTQEHGFDGDRDTLRCDRCGCWCWDDYSGDWFAGEYFPVTDPNDDCDQRVCERVMGS